jgi:hypothetical protein
MADETNVIEEISTTSIKKEISHCEMLATFLTDEDLNDVALKGTDGIEVSANRFLLAARSKVFRAMFFEEFREAKSPAVELGFQGNVLRAVVEYIVTDSVEMLTTRKRKIQDKTKPPYDFKNIEALVFLMEAACYFYLPELGKQVFALFKQIMCNWPCLAFPIMKACKRVGPTINSELTDAALQHVHVLPFETIAADQIYCLSAQVLETILKNNKMDMTEYNRFQILQQWMEAAEDSLSSQSDRHAIAANL